MDISAIAIQGLQQADTQLQRAATTIASLGTADEVNPDTVDLASEMIALTSAKGLESANITALKAGEEMQKKTLDLLA
jgi:hypothetical protein